MTSQHELIVLQRDCPGVLVPSGRPTALRSGETLVLVQRLGGSFTLQNEQGQLVRVASADADALGLDTPDSDVQDATSEETPVENKFSLEHVLDELRSVYDPELPINVVDLGLIYACEATALSDGTQRVEIKMSMTAPGCGMGDVLREDARRTVSAVPGVSEVKVELVWDPPWNLSLISEAARLQLGLY